MEDEKTYGSENRRRSQQVPVRFDVAELEALDAKCEAAGLSRAGFLRKAALGRAGARSKRKPSFDRRELEQLQAALHAAALSNTRIGTNLNQIAHQLNAEGLPELPDDIKALLDKTQQAIADCLASIEDGKPATTAAYNYLREALGYDR